VFLLSSQKVPHEHRPNRAVCIHCGALGDIACEDCYQIALQVIKQAGAPLLNPECRVCTLLAADVISGESENVLISGNGEDEK
jgi:hypothetical protein